MTVNEARIKQTGLIKSYMSYKMVVTLLLFLGFIFYMREDLYVRFMAHPSLNALIVGTMMVSIGSAFVNIFKIQASARLIKALERYEDAPSEEAALKIIKKLRKKARLINTFYLEGAVLTQKEPGSLKFWDNQVRIMKSKVGQRTSRMRHSVQYMAGVLVMLGLIGTFWGLLETITSVGEAMATIVESFSKAGEEGGQNGMVDFLKAISKPLQGMGIAFSASLFGLSGSLVTGLLNSFCGKGMDKFLEDFSNWLDSRIPEAEKKDAPATPVELIERHNEMMAKALEHTLSGMTQQSQQMFTLFSELIHELTEFGTQQAALVRQLTIEKRETMRLANTFEGAINALNANFSTISESISFLPIIAKEVRNDVVNLNSTVQNTQQSFLNQQKLTSDQIIESTRQGAQLYNSLNTLFESNRTLANAHSQIVEALENLSHDNADQKNKVIEMVLVMQHILQDQMEKNDSDVTYLDDKERA